MPHQHLDPGATAMSPRRASGVVLHGPMAGSGYTNPPLLVQRADGQMSQLTPLLYAVLEAMDGRRDWDAIARAVEDRVVRPVTAADVRYLATEKLLPAGLMTLPDGSQPVTTRRNPLLGLRARLVISNPAVTSRVVAPFAGLFSPLAAVPLLTAFALVTWWVIARQGLQGAVDDAMRDPSLLLVVVAGTIVSAAFHELGHAAACRYGGAKPGAIGAAVYLVWPVFYTDVTDAYRLNRWGRLRVDLGGIYFNAVFAVGVFAAWAATGAEALLVLVPIQLFQMLRQLIPVVRFDGYHILADLTGVPDLFARIGPTLLGLIGKGDGSHRRLKPWARRVVTAWVLLVVPALGALFAVAVVNLPSIFGTSIESLAFHARNLTLNIANGDVPRVLIGVVAMVTIALIPLGLAYVLARLSTRLAGGMWRATEDHPALRGLGSTAVLALVAATTMSWMPAPLPDGHPGLVAAGMTSPKMSQVPLTVVDAADPAAGPTWDEASFPSPGSRELAPRVAENPRASGRASLGKRPAAALLVAPVDDWPFPFDPPEEARPGDNVVVAVNTTDGSSIYEYASVLTWLTDDAIVDDRNRAVALASCTNCTTRAIAMHVVVVVGDADIVVPESSAVALNYECERCVTDAVAVQLVVTLEEMPAEDVVAAVEELWAQLDAAEARLGTAPVEEVHAELTQIRAQILTLLTGDPTSGGEAVLAAAEPGDHASTRSANGMVGRGGTRGGQTEAPATDRRGGAENEEAPVIRPARPVPAATEPEDAPAPVAIPEPGDVPEPETAAGPTAEPKPAAPARTDEPMSAPPAIDPREERRAVATGTSLG